MVQPIWRQVPAIRERSINHRHVYTTQTASAHVQGIPWLQHDLEHLRQNRAQIQCKLTNKMMDFHAKMVDFMRTSDLAADKVG